MTVSPWVFKQLTAAPGSSLKSFTLSDAAAPHGRPRQKAIVADGIEIREKTVYYPDNDIPTRHIFGVKYDDWELTGRFRDATLGAGGQANFLVQKIQDFVKDGQRMEVSWGQIISYTGIIKHFKPMRESDAEIPWTMRILIDVPTNNEQKHLTAQQTKPSATAKQIFDGTQENIVKPLKAKLNIRGLTGQFVDSVDGLVSSINTFTGSLVDITKEFDSFDSALIQQVDRLRAGVHQLRTAIITLRNTIQATTIEGKIIARQADTDINWTFINTGLQAHSITTLALLQDLDNQAELSQRNQSRTTYVAKGNDSWETISIHFFGGPEWATKIRNINGIRYAEQPIPGRRYIIPR